MHVFYFLSSSFRNISGYFYRVRMLSGIIQMNEIVRDLLLWPLSMVARIFSVGRLGVGVRPKLGRFISARFDRSAVESKTVYYNSYVDNLSSVGPGRKKSPR